MSEELAIMKIVSSMGLLTDAHEWDAVVDLFSERVLVDYTSLNGGEPVTLASDELVAGWRANLERLQITQHLIGNHVVDVTADGDKATCACNVTATHVQADATGDPLWVVGGRYDTGLSKQDGRWRISSLTLTVAWVTGNQAIMMAS